MKKLPGNYTRMLFWTNPRNSTLQNSSCTTTNLSSHKPSKVRVRHAGHCWRCKDKLISNILQWTPAYVHTYVGWIEKTFLHQLCTGIGGWLEELPKTMTERDGWWERGKGICVVGPTWWVWTTLLLVCLNFIYTLSSLICKLLFFPNKTNYCFHFCPLFVVVLLSYMLLINCVHVW